jgi:hypothetical protein
MRVFQAVNGRLAELANSGPDVVGVVAAERGTALAAAKDTPCNQDQG